MASPESDQYGTSEKGSVEESDEDTPPVEHSEFRLSNDETRNMEEEQFPFSKRSLFCFTPQNWLRKICIWMVSVKAFEWIITGVIVLNTLTLGMVDY